MKRVMILAMAAVGLLTTPSFGAGNDYVYAVFGDQKERIRKLDRKTTSVCTLKKMIADVFDLNPRKFELRKRDVNGFKLNEDRTLDGDSLMNGSVVAVKEVSHSFQCD